MRNSKDKGTDREKRIHSCCGLVITFQKESLTDKDKELSPVTVNRHLWSDVTDN